MSDCFISYGLPMMIDLADCDRLFPSIHDHTLSSESEGIQNVKPPYIVHHWMLSLTIILGKVIKLLYSASKPFYNADNFKFRYHLANWVVLAGVLNVTDQQLEDVQAELSLWHKILPENLRFVGVDSNFDAGFLHVCSIPVSFLLRRPFFGKSYEIDRHTSFAMTFDYWQELYIMSQEAIFWIDKNVAVLENWFPAMYSLIVCALIQVGHDCIYE